VRVVLEAVARHAHNADVYALRSPRSLRRLLASAGSMALTAALVHRGSPGGSIERQG
jgi:hypothetical protein